MNFQGLEKSNIQQPKSILKASRFKKINNMDLGNVKGKQGAFNKIIQSNQLGDKVLKKAQILEEPEQKDGNKKIKRTPVVAFNLIPSYLNFKNLKIFNEQKAQRSKLFYYGDESTTRQNSRPRPRQTQERTIQIQTELNNIPIFESKGNNKQFMFTKVESKTIKESDDNNKDVLENLKKPHSNLSPENCSIKNMETLTTQQEQGLLAKNKKRERAPITCYEKYCAMF